MLSKSIILSVLALWSAFAGQVVVGDPSNSNNCIPFGCTTVIPTPRYQQVYDASLFAGPMTISQIVFFADGIAWDQNLLGSDTWDLYLTTTGRPVNSLLDSYDDNVGLDRALFATINGGVTISDVWEIPGNPFFYDPSAGNLLLDIIRTSEGQNGDLFLNASYSTSYSRKYQNYFDFGYGLVTGFDYEMAAVPEPGALNGLALLGVGIVAGLQRRRRT